MHLSKLLICLLFYILLFAVFDPYSQYGPLQSCQTAVLSLTLLTFWHQFLVLVASFLRWIHWRCTVCRTLIYYKHKQPWVCTSRFSLIILILLNLNLPCQNFPNVFSHTRLTGTYIFVLLFCLFFNKKS